MLNPKIILIKTHTDKNPYTFSQIEFLEFNYDGNGSALVLEDGRLSFRHLKDIQEIMFGGVEVNNEFIRWFNPLDTLHQVESIH